MKIALIQVISLLTFLELFAVLFLFFPDVSGEVYDVYVLTAINHLHPKQFLSLLVKLGEKRA